MVYLSMNPKMIHRDRLVVFERMRYTRSRFVPRSRPAAPSLVPARLTPGILVATITIAYVIGVWVGASVFAKVQPRGLLALTHCEQTCLRPSEFAGLIASIGIQVAPNQLPLVVAETEKSIAFVHPIPEDQFHFVIVPKKDIRNIGELAQEDQAYLTDAYALMQDLVQSHSLSKYRIKTNGPGYQKVAYLHFHLMGER